MGTSQINLAGAPDAKLMDPNPEFQTRLCKKQPPKYAELLRFRAVTAKSEIATEAGVVLPSCKSPPWA